MLLNLCRLVPNLSFRFGNHVCIPHTCAFWMNDRLADGAEFCPLVTWYNAHLHGYDLHVFLPMRILWQVVLLLLWNPFKYLFGWASVSEGSIPLWTQFAFLFSCKSRACTRACLPGIILKIQSNTILWFPSYCPLLHSSGPFTSFVCFCRLWELCISYRPHVTGIWSTGFKGVCIILWVILSFRQLLSLFGFGSYLG